MRVNCREQIANPAEPVNGQDERRKCAAVDSPARLCCSVIKRATAQDAAALCHYSERGIFHDRTRKVSRTYPAYSIAPYGFIIFNGISLTSHPHIDARTEHLSFYDPTFFCYLQNLCSG